MINCVCLSLFVLPFVLLLHPFFFLHMTYTTDQKFDDITITIKNIHGSVKVSVKNKQIEVKCNDAVIFDKTLQYDVKEEEIVWYVDNDELYIELTKEKKQWWDAFFVGDEKIDTEELAKNVPVNMDHLDDESRRMIQKMMYEQKEKKTQDEEMKRKIMQMSAEMTKKEDNE